MTVWDGLWLFWLALFGVIEGVALYQSGKAKGRGEADPRDTLSEHVWYWMGINTKGGVGVERNVGGWAWTRRTALAVFLLWLGVHMLGGGGIV